MLLFYLLFALIWIFGILFIGTQVVYPMFSDAEFFWFFRYGKIKHKYNEQFDEKHNKMMENEIKNELNGEE